VMTEQELIENDILAFIDQNQTKELLRFVTVGSVDDGKSTLIGRLLYDSKGAYEDQLEEASTTTADGEKAIDFARLTDGLRAEREQGITIDVAYRYFSTPVRKFIIADTPGHVQYTRNMATGASTANVAIILIDARLGVLTQSRRHATIANLLGIPHLLVVVNKMDLVDYKQERFDEIVEDFSGVVDGLDFSSVTCLPASALMGVNIVERSERTAWFNGPTVLEYLETVEITAGRNYDDFRMPIQVVLRPNLDYRAFAGQIASGVLRKGDPVTVLPSGKTSVVKAIDVYSGELEAAQAPLSVAVRLEDEIDISRGDILVKSGGSMPSIGRTVSADMVWMSETPLDPAKSYLIKHGTRYVRVNVDAIESVLDLETFERTEKDSLDLNDIGTVRLTAHSQIVFDPYRENRGMGAMILIDSVTNNTVAAAMIRGARKSAGPIRVSEETQVSTGERAERLGHSGAVVSLVGGHGPTRSTVAFAAERALMDLGVVSTVLDARDPRYNTKLDDVAGTAIRMRDAGLVVLTTYVVGGALPVQVSEDSLDNLEAAVAGVIDELRNHGIISA